MTEDDAYPMDTCFVALTRPTMKWGVPYEGLKFNAALSMAAAVITTFPPAGIASFVAAHFVMRFLATIDPNFFRLRRLWLETKGASITSTVWGGSSLAAMPARITRAKDFASSV